MRYFILKEFLKFKLAFYFFVASVCFCMAWIYFSIQGAIAKYTISFYTLQVMYNKNFSFNHLDEINLLFALIIAVNSMFFERQNARIRVQFHYPHSYLKNTLLITLIPLCFLLFLYIFELICIYLMLSSFFPIEIVLALISTLLNSCLFSIGLFFATQSIVIEPNFKRALATLCIGIASIFIYFKINPDVGNSMLYYLNDMAPLYSILWIVFGVSLLALSLDNYKKGYIK